MIDAVEFVTDHAGRRAALYRLCIKDDDGVVLSQQSKEGSSVVNDLALLERRAYAEGFSMME